MRYVERDLRGRFHLYLRTFPVVMVIGPRQCGKSTFARHELPAFAHFDLERQSDALQVTTDIELFLREHPREICVDEAQRVPELFPALRHAVDSGKGTGRFVLLGFAGPELLRTASESLAGRVGIVRMPPFTAHELAGRVPWLDRWWWGGLPPLHELESDEQRLAWIGSYVTTVFERDLPGLGVRVPSQRLLRFWTMLMHLNGRLLNVSDLAHSMEVSIPAAGRYLDILEGAFMIRRLPPFFANIGKRLVKRPKLYVRDTGLLHWLAGLRRRGDLDAWSGKGASFESLVASEVMARAEEELSEPRFAFYRTHAGAEVDLLVEDGRRIIPVEIKHGASVGQYDTAGLRSCMKDLGVPAGWIVTRGDTVRAIGNGITAVPWEGVVDRSISFWTAEA
jgi:predicted AAA+ superfamily ATPase